MPREDQPLVDRPASLKETCRAVGGRVPLWPWHRERLAGGGVPSALLDLAENCVLAAAAEWAGTTTRRARLTLVVAPDDSLTVDVAQRLSSLDVVGGVRIARVDVAEPPPLPTPAAKPADRVWWDAAHKRARALGADQAVLVAPEGNVVDGSTAAIWIAEGDTLLTPPAPPAIPSVSVAFVRARADAAGLDARVEAFSWERFEAADEAFLTNAFGGAMAVRGRGGAGFSAVRAIFDAVWAR
jgi:branched-subunit amino acid aminotransferase/4-amino-4-deoxychorismate lyase